MTMPIAPWVVAAGLAIFPRAGFAEAQPGALAWLLLPLSGAGEHHIELGTAWHARAMVLAWAVCLPLGALTARFFKVRPGQDWPRQLDDKVWWHVHRTLQYGGVIAMSLGLALALAQGWSSGAGAAAGRARAVHAVLGWALCLAGWTQVIGGWLRGTKGGPGEAQLRGDHYDMSPWRQGFESLHKRLGWGAVVLAVPVIGLGLYVADAPRWMAVVLALWWAALGAVFASLQAQGRCMDTYQAIWGPGEMHPGNQRPVTGWGVRRYALDSWRERFGPR